MLLFWCAALSRAQSGKQPQRGFHPGGSYSLSEIETISHTGGNLMLRVPLASLPSGRGGSPGAGVSLVYNSKLWDPKATMTPQGTLTELVTSPEGNWRYGYRYDLQVIDKRNEYYAPYGGGPGTCTSASGMDDGARLIKVRMRFPDGGMHEFRPSGESSVHYNPEGYYDLEPNGRRYYCRSVGAGWPNDYVLDSEQPTYTRRTYYSTDGTYMRLDIDFTAPDGSGLRKQFWTLYLPDGGRVTVDPDLGVTGAQRIYDRNDNYIEISSATSSGLPAVRINDQLGRSMFIETDSAARKDYIRVLGFGAEILTWTVSWKSIVVNKSYPTLYGTRDMSATLGVVESVTLPVQAGGLSYVFEYNAGTANPSVGWGEVSAVVLPTGARAEYTYKEDNINNSGTLPVMQNHPTRKDLKYRREYDGESVEVTETWTYGFGFGGGGSTATGAVVTAPDGGVTTEYFTNNSGKWDNGLPIYSRGPDGTLVERDWRANTPQGEAVAMNPYVKTEFTSITNAAGTLAKTKIKDFNFDKNGNLTSVKEYDWADYASVHSGGSPVWNAPRPALLRESATGYYNATPGASDTTTNDPDAYHKPTSPRKRNTAHWAETRGAAGILSRAEFFYDSPHTRGNLTEQRSWDSTTATLLPTQPDGSRLDATNAVFVNSQYDQYGNLLRTTEPGRADGTRSQTAYVYGPISERVDLYPTEVIAAEGTPRARTTRTEYDISTGLVTRVTDADNNVSTATTYDALGRPTLVKAAEGTPEETRTATAYSDGARRVIVRADLDALGDGGLVTVRYFDQLGRVRLSRTLEDAAAQDELVEADGIKVQTRYKFSGQHGHVLVSNPYRAAPAAAAAGEETMGWTLSVSDRGGRVVRVETFAGAGLPAPFADANPNTASTGAAVTVYDAETVTVTDQAGKTRRSVTDAVGRLAQVVEAPDAPDYNHVTNYTYNALDNLTQVSQGAQTRSYVYSSLSRLVSATNPEVCQRQQPQGACVAVPVIYEHDPNGNLKRKTDARGVTTDYTYDELNRMLTRSYSGGTPNVTYGYDATDVAYSKGRLTTVVSGVSTYSYTAYDALGRATASAQTVGDQTYTMGYAYNRAGALKSQTYPSGKVVATDYDRAGRVAGVKNQATGGFYAGAAATDADDRLRYTAHGALAAAKLGNGLWEHTSFNSRLQPTRIGLGSSPTDFGKLRLDYGYGPDATNNGNVRSQTIHAPGLPAPLSQSYEYDALNRLATAEEKAGGAPVWAQVYKYDRFGNRTLDAGTTYPTQLTHANNPALDPATNRISSDGYEYDASGNLLCDPVRPCGAGGEPYFAYDGENRVVAVGGGVNAYGGATYYYDGDGRRVKKVLPTQTIVFVYDASGQLLAEYSNQGAANGVSYLTQDHLGSTRVVTGHSPRPDSRHDYLPFGEEIVADLGGRTTDHGYSRPDGVRQKFTGYERDDEAGLDFAQARYFSYTHGRFTSPDNFLNDSDLSDPQSWNKYAYARNNPLKYVDPTGEKVDYKVTIDTEKKRITLTAIATIGVWSSDSKIKPDLKAIAKGLEKQIEKKWKTEFKENGWKIDLNTQVSVQAFDKANSTDDVLKTDGSIMNVLEVRNKPVTSQIDPHLSLGQGTTSRSPSIKNPDGQYPDTGILEYPDALNDSLGAHEYTHMQGAINAGIRGQDVSAPGAGAAPKMSIFDFKHVAGGVMRDALVNAIRAQPARMYRTRKTVVCCK